MSPRSGARLGPLVGLQCLMLAHAAVGAEPPPPQHVMSLSLCTDALLLQLLPPQRIASVTYLARRSSDPMLAAQAARVGVNYGSAEEVLAETPDLILAGTYSTPATRALLRQLHAPVLVVPAAADFSQIRTVVRRVAQVLDAGPRAEALLAQMDDTLAALARTRPVRAVRVAAWSGDGYVPGKGTLFNAVLEAAGGINVAATRSGDRSGSFDIEQLLMAQPEVLAYGDEELRTPALATERAQHPLLRRLYAHRRIRYPELPVECGLPQSADAARALRGELLAVTDAPAPQAAHLP